MDSLIGSVNAQAVLVIGAIAVAILFATLLIRILRASFGLILTILAIVLVLQYGFGISPGQIWAEISNLPQDMIQILQGFDPSAFASAFSSLTSVLNN